MKLKNIFLTVAIASLGFSSTSAFAKSDDVNVGIVNFQKALQDVQNGKTARASLEKEVAKKRGKVESLQKEVQKMNDTFQKKMSVLSEKARTEEGMKIQQKVGELQQLQQQSQMELQQKEVELTKPIIEGLRALIPELSRKRKLDFVFEASAGVLLYSKSQTDITEELIALYDEKNKK
ncbi:OmpH family outer membrane protein [bacterium]|nr:OmpH family outer membrane protein [bacterium]